MAQSPFDFSDQFGSDPMMRRYDRVTSYDVRGAELRAQTAMARRELAKAEFETAQSELEAKLAPMKMASDMVTSMSNLLTQKNSIEKDTRMRRDSANLTSTLNKVESLDELRDLVSVNQFGMDDEQTAALVTDRATSLFRAAADNATSTYDVDKLYASLPTSVASKTELINMHKNLSDMAGRREKVLTGVAEIKLPFSPVTPTGELDVARGEQILAAERTKKDLEKEAQAEAEKRIDNIRQSYGIVTRRLAEAPPMSQPDPQLVALKNSLESQLVEYSKSLIPGIGQPPSDGSKPSGTAGVSDWTTDLIPQGVAVPPSKSAGQGGTDTVPTTAAEAAAEAASEPNVTPTPTPTPVPATSRTKTAAELRAAQKKVDTLTKELDAMKEASGLAKQPWGIRQINEALSSENAAIRAKAQELQQAQLDINPLANADENNAQDVAAALKLVYPEISGGGMTPKFDVGNPKDSRVMAAAMFLQKVRPEFLRMVASDPGVARGGLGFHEIDEIVRNQPITTGKRTTRK